MQSNLQEIIDELFRLDPELRKQEAELRNIISTMLENRPDSTLDMDFKNELQNKIEREIRQMKKETKPSTYRLLGFIIPFLFGGAVFASMMIVSPVGQYLQDILYPKTTETVPKTPENLTFKQDTTTSSDNSTSTGADIPTSDTKENTEAKTPTVSPQKNNSDRGAVIAFNLNVKKSGDRAFGAIQRAPSSAFWKGGAEASNAPVAWDSKIAAPTADMGLTMPYEPITYRHTYSGSTLKLEDTSFSVLKKTKERFQSAELDTLLKKFHFSWFDIASLENFRLDTMTLSEDREYGLQVNVDLSNGMIGAYRNWPKWPQSKCQTEECFRNERLELSDIPSDETLLRLASEFIKKYKIDLSHYGTPIINDDWRREYDRASDKSMAYIPESISVVYPLIIDGKEVYEEYGAKKWITLGIDIRSKRVAEFSGMEKLDFIASNYEADTDFTHIKSLAEAGDKNMPIHTMDSAGSGKTVDIILGTPTISYVKIYGYSNGLSDEYLVPAAIFPTTSTSKEYFPRNVIVPLVKDFQTSNSTTSVPYGMPEAR